MICEAILKFKRDKKREREKQLTIFLKHDIVYMTLLLFKIFLAFNKY